MFAPTSPLLKAGSSSAKWLARQGRDPFVKQRAQQPVIYRSRAAFKLLQIDERYSLFDSVVRNERRYREQLEGRESDGSSESVAIAKEGECLDSAEAVIRAQTPQSKCEAGPSRTRTTPTTSRPRRVVLIDLGAAPGGWSQVIARKFGNQSDHRFVQTRLSEVIKEQKGVASDIPTGDGAWSSQSAQGAVTRSPNYKDLESTIIALDILPITPIPGVKTIRYDFLSPDADLVISSLLPADQQKADLILSDIAVNISGNKQRDQAAGEEVLRSVYHFAEKHLRTKDDLHPGGWLVVKFFASKFAADFRKTILKRSFSQCFIHKPPASRSESSESYFVCKGFRGSISLTEEGSLANTGNHLMAEGAHEDRL